ncbi:MAG: DUF1016 N-terminal domain-containing protein [Planctomycetota bacterium]|jgi:hypothetical protein
MQQPIAPGYARLLKECADLRSVAYGKVMLGLLQYYWDLGNLINRFLEGENAVYGRGTIAMLSRDLKMGKTDIYNAIRLNTKFSKTELSPKLTWSHYRALLPLETRVAKSLADKAAEKAMPLRTLKGEITRVKARKYGKDKKDKFSIIQLNALLNPISGIPDMKEITRINIREITESNYKKLRDKIKLAEKKLKNILKFIENLERAKEKSNN